ncbi:beta-lactamase family protein [Streptosporangium sp. NBC_01495]|uniref:serine hydrolase domain-containing protein n=1 Tax=Streptosporangium sp. NBC_01495 TaxID=2903899 RepID=UPI002E32F224|nr:serine hydrolase domain-containing protein [Streptosporangium sp. NBC_01495]
MPKFKITNGPLPRRLASRLPATGAVTLAATLLTAVTAFAGTGPPPVAPMSLTAAALAGTGSPMAPASFTSTALTGTGSPTAPTSSASAALTGTGPATGEIGPASVDRFVNAYREATGLPGAAVAVTRGNEVVHVAGYGRTSSGDPVTADTPMAIASLSKSFTSLAVMQLVEKGAVRLDEPVRVRLPEFVMADPRAARITVRQLLDQTSGMADEAFPERSLPQPRSLREAVARLRGARLAADPGTRWSYHNTNSQVAARLVEVASGMPFAGYLGKHVFGPLGMRNSTTIDTERDLPASARGHLRLLGAALALPEPPGFGNGSGGVISSARDMAQWMIMQNGEGAGPGGVRVVSAASVAEMRTPSRINDSYALGWSIGTTGKGSPVVEHGGDLLTATAQQTLLPRSGYGIVVMANTGTAYADSDAIADALVAMAEGEEPEPPPSVSPSLIIDLAMALAAAATLLLAGRGLARSRRWAARRAGRPAWRAAARLLPYAAPGVLCLTITDVFAVLARGKDTTWRHVAYLYPSFMIWLVLATGACLALILVRIDHLVRTRRAPSPGSG